VEGGMSEPRMCVRCGKPIEVKRFRKYCSYACADSAARDRIKLHKAQGRMQVRLGFYRYYPKADSE
jgi:predicted nucleic acid-binding Zn ribbon protein